MADFDFLSPETYTPPRADQVNFQFSYIIEGIIKNTLGSAAAGAVVSIRRVSDDFELGSTITDSEGFYSIGVNESGLVRIVASKKGMLSTNDFEVV